MRWLIGAWLFCLIGFLLTGCTNENVQLGKTYKVKSGFYKGCIATAKSAYERSSPCFDCLEVTLGGGDCPNGDFRYGEEFDSSNLEEVKSGSSCNPN